MKHFTNTSNPIDFPKKNERIQELARQAGVFEMLSNNIRWDEFSEKFAELIVKECMRMCDVAATGYDTHGLTKEASGCDTAKEYIADWFEIE